jgi:hypothetical protein
MNNQEDVGNVGEGVSAGLAKGWVTLSKEAIQARGSWNPILLWNRRISYVPRSSLNQAERRKQL